MIFSRSLLFPNLSGCICPSTKIQVLCRGVREWLSPLLLESEFQNSNPILTLCLLQNLRQVILISARPNFLISKIEIVVEPSSLLKILVRNHLKCPAKCLVPGKPSVVITLVFFGGGGAQQFIVYRWYLPQCSVLSLLAIQSLISFHRFVFICNFTSQVILVWLVRDPEDGAKKRA